MDQIARARCWTCHRPGVRIPKFGGSALLVHRSLAGDNLSHPRTNVRSEGGSHDHHSHRSGHSLDGLRSPGRPVVGHGPGRMDPRPAATHDPGRPPSPSSWPRYRPKPLASLIPWRRRAGRAPHHGDWLATSTAPRRACRLVGPPPRLRDVLPETATALATGPSPSTMSGRSAPAPHHR